MSYYSIRRLAALSAASALALVCAQTPAFEVASIKPNTASPGMIGVTAPEGSGTLTATNASLKDALAFAWKVKSWEISGGAGWVVNERFDITAKAPEGSTATDLIRQMTQSLLAERFNLAVHRETREMPIYALVAAKGGLKLQPGKEGSCVTPDPKTPVPPPRAPGQRPPAPCGSWYIGPASFVGGKISIAQFADGLSNLLARPVVDKTGYKGTFDIQLEFSPEGTAFANGLPGFPGLPPNLDTSGPSIFTAVQDQLGIKLDSQKGTGEMLVIDRAERPTEN
jgi:uncharacterized protein (TIGR03435 family)